MPSGRSPGSLRAAGAAFGVLSSALQSGWQAVARCGRWRCCDRLCSGATRTWRTAVTRSGPALSKGSPIGKMVNVGASGRRLCAAPVVGGACKP